MLPELFRIPGLNIPLSTYGVLLAAAFLTSLWLAARLAAQDGLPRQKVYDLGLYVLAAGLIGSKLLMIVTEWDEFGLKWRRVFSLDLLQSGGVFFGGFLAAVGVSVFLVHRWQLPWRRTSDSFAPAIALGHAIGRLGCFSAGCCWGKPTTSWIGVTFTQKASEITGVPFDVRLVPTQLIEALVNLLIFASLMIVRKRRTFDGQVFFAYLILYSIARFMIEFWRDDPRGEILGLSTSQFVSVLMLPAGLALMLYYRRKSQVERLTGSVAAQPS